MTSADPWSLATIAVRREGAVLFAAIDAPPMNLLGPELVRDLVSLIERADADETLKVLVFTSADPETRDAEMELAGMLGDLAAPGATAPG